MPLTHFVMNQIQAFSTVLNHFKFNSTKFTNIQFSLFNFEAFSTNSTIVRPNNEFRQPPKPAFFILCDVKPTTSSGGRKH